MTTPIHGGLLKRKVHQFIKPPAIDGYYPARGELYYIKGCNGSGKSTVPSYLASTDPQAYVVTHNGKILLTVCPSYDLICVGKYDHSKSKGVDSLTDTEQMMMAVEITEQPDYAEFDVIFEGIIPATILNTWVERLDRPARKLWTLFIDTPLDVCLSRVDTRNGGQEYDRDLVASKWNRIKSHRERHYQLFPTVSAGMIKSHGMSIPGMVELFLNREFGEIEC